MSFIKNFFSKEFLIFILITFFYFIFSNILFIFNLHWIVLIISLVYFLILFGLFFKEFTVFGAKSKNLAEIGQDYVSVMLVLAMLFNFIFISVVFGGSGSFHSCDDLKNKISPSYYFSVSNIFSLSYTEQICFSGSLLKLIIAAEGIIGSLITIIILGVIIARFSDRSKK